jgi:hypothetical protein
MSSKKLDLSKVGPGRTNIDRNSEMEAKPSSGSATPKHKLSASQSNGAGNAWKNAGASVNGMSVILGGGTPTGASSLERTGAPKSKTPNKAVQHARNEHVRRENGGEDTTGKRRS